MICPLFVASTDLWWTSSRKKRRKVLPIHLRECGLVPPPKLVQLDPRDRNTMLKCNVAWRIKDNVALVSRKSRYTCVTENRGRRDVALGGIILCLFPTNTFGNTTMDEFCPHQVSTRVFLVQVVICSKIDDPVSSCCTIVFRPRGYLFLTNCCSWFESWIYVVLLDQSIGVLWVLDGWIRDARVKEFPLLKSSFWNSAFCMIGMILKHEPHYTWVHESLNQTQWNSTFHIATLLKYCMTALEQNCVWDPSWDTRHFPSRQQLFHVTSWTLPLSRERETLLLQS